MPPGSDGSAKIKGDDWAYGWQVGGLWKLTANDRIALNYRSKIKHNLEGTGNFTMPTNVTAVLSNPAVGALLGTGQPPFTHTDGRAGFTTPSIATASFWHQDEKFGLGFDLSWTKWDSFKNLTVNYSNPNQPPTSENYSWRNSWFASVGGEYYLDDKFTLRGGVAVDSTPTYDDTRSPRVPDSTRRWLAVGLGYKATGALRDQCGLCPHLRQQGAHRRRDAARPTIVWSARTTTRATCSASRPSTSSDRSRDPLIPPQKKPPRRRGGFFIGNVGAASAAKSQQSEEANRFRAEEAKKPRSKKPRSKKQNKKPNAQ